jgi:hypothetical protein
MAHAVVMLSHRHGPHSITNQGHAQLPLAIRRAFGLEAGERLLMAACPDHDLLVVYTMASLDAIILAYHASFAEEALE